MVRWLLALVLAVSSVADAEPQPQEPTGQQRPRVRRQRVGQQGPMAGTSKARGAQQGAAAAAARPRGGGVDGDGVARAGVANSFLSQGKARAAAFAYRRQLETDPEAPSLHVGLGRALSRLGACDEALDHLQPYVGYAPFGLEAALAASDCAGRLGLHADAVWYAQMAVDEDPENARSLTTLALAAQRYGDGVSLADALYRLESLDRDASMYARAAIALRMGDLTELDILLQLLLRDGRSTSDAARLGAAAWMDLDDPLATTDVLAAVMRPGHARVGPRVLRAEALRRIGNAEGARNVLDPERGLALEGMEADAVMARALIDLGELDVAEVRLSSYANYDDPDVLASRWYLARARRDDAQMALLAERYAQVQASPLRVLANLVPVGER